MRGLRLRCPACGETALYRSLFKMRESCAACGLVFEREQGYFMGAIYVNVIVTEMLILGTYLGSLLFTSGTDDRVYYVMFALAVVLPLAFFHHSRSLWLTLDQIVSPPPTPKKRSNSNRPPLRRDDGKK
ncbi:MAG TPA: DUF983 domain-containing protein [Pyrinomonadaceae bacterium]|nr:DUF983 domain-containing protein [Pyrinomonadaceae bacterium]